MVSQQVILRGQPFLLVRTGFLECSLEATRHGEAVSGSLMEKGSALMFYPLRFESFETELREVPGFGFLVRRSKEPKSWKGFPKSWIDLRLGTLK